MRRPSFSKPASKRRVGHAIALAAFVGFAIATPLGGRAFGRACAAGNAHVAVIVDLGSGGTASALCVPANDNENGEALLSARASMLGTPQPRYAPSGLLCAIDGIPSTGCGGAQNGHYAYWSYWHGTGGGWSYSNVGPGSTLVTPGVVEGWRWQPDGTGRPSDPPPRAPAAASAVCPPPAPPTTTTRTPTVVSPRSTPPPPATTPATVSTPPAGPGVIVKPAGSGPPVTTGSTASPTSRPGSRPATTARGHPPTTAAASTVRIGDSSTTVELVPRGLAAPAGPHSSGGAPVGAIVGVTLVVAFGGAALMIARRRRATT